MERFSWVFGVPKTALPLTSVTLSATRSLRRCRSTRSTRNAAISPKRKPQYASSRIVVPWSPAA
jgi:hypothetical protein